MAIQRLLVSCLLTATLHWMDVLGQDKNDTALSIGHRVIGGDKITNEMLGGYFVALRYQNSFVCGGALIDDLFVLTAAHCFESRPYMEDWVVDGGVSRLSDTGQRRQIRRMNRAAAFRMATMDMDVAVLLLDKPMKGKGINKIKLCEKHLAAGESMVVAGFGMVSPSGKGPDHFLRSATVPIVTKKACRSAYNQSTPITNSMMCASAPGKRDACTYDSGGPLVHNNQVCGIVSFGIGCASDKYPGVYTDVNYVKPFISKSMKSLLSKTRRP